MDCVKRYSQRQEDARNETEWDHGRSGTIRTWAGGVFFNLSYSEPLFVVDFLLGRDRGPTTPNVEQIVRSFYVTSSPASSYLSEKFLI